MSYVRKASQKISHYLSQRNESFFHPKVKNEVWRGIPSTVNRTKNKNNGLSTGFVLYLKTIGLTIMIKLHGFSASNYYNVPKLALLEKGIEFEEVLSYSGAGPKYKPEYLDKSPLGKVPAIETPEGFISESRSILEYIERAYPTPSLLPNTALE